MSILSRSLRLALALVFLACAACRAPDPPPEGARAAASGELIGPVVNDDVRRAAQELINLMGGTGDRTPPARPL